MKYELEKMITTIESEIEEYIDDDYNDIYHREKIGELKSIVILLKSYLKGHYSE